MRSPRSRSVAIDPSIPQHGSTMRLSTGAPRAGAERAASGRRPSEPDPGNAGAGMVARNRRPGRRRTTVSDDIQRPTAARDDVVVPLKRSRSADGGPEGLDAVVVGGGVIGLACAWRAARRGVRVRVLERDHPGAGASHVAAGMLAPVGEANWGEEALMRMALTSARAWPGFAAELAEDSQLPVGYETCGALHIALDRDEAEELRRRYELMDSLDLGVEWLRPDACRDVEPGLAPACAGGVLAPGEAAVDPGRLVPALAAAVERSGGQLFVEAEVTDVLTKEGRLAGVVTGDGREHRA